MSKPLDYVGRCPECGRLLTWMIGEGSATPKEVAKEVAGWIRDGLQVERMATEAARADDFGHTEVCSVGEKDRKRATRKAAK